MMNIFKKPIFWILILALVVRFYKLGSFPIGFHVDEVKVGWESLSIAKTLKDDKLNFLPLYYNSFGDYRPTGIFYLSMPAIFIFGNTPFAVRFTSALFGSLSVVLVYLLLKNFKKDFDQSENVAYFSAFTLAILPWHISVSRATSEVAISLFFILLTIYSFIKVTSQSRWKYLIIAAASTFISYSLYHSARILLPLYLFSLTVFFKDKINLRNILIFVFSVLLTVILTFQPESKERLKQVSIFKSEGVVFEVKKSNENKYLIYTKTLVKEYGKYFSTDFLIGDSARPFRYMTPGFGIIGYLELTLLIIGSVLIVREKRLSLFLVLMLISPISSILTHEDSPNLHRSFYMSAFIAIIIGFAISKIKYKRATVTLLVLSLLYFLTAHFKNELHLPYQTVYIDSPTYRNVGYSEFAKRIDDLSIKYDKVYITYFPDSVYTWYAFLNNKDPKEINNASYIVNTNQRIYKNIIFTDMKCPSDSAFDNDDKNILVIDSGECAIETKIKDRMPARIIEEVKRQDGTILFYLIERDEKNSVI